MGIDPNPTIPPAQTQLAAGNTGRLMDPLYRNPYSQQWNAGYAFQLSQSSVVELEYVHELALHESKTININPTGIGPGPGFAGTPRPLSAAFTAAGLPALGRIDDEQSIGRSRYDGLNLSFRQRMTHHVSINTNYVLSRAVAYNGNAAAFRNRPTIPSNPFNPADFGPVPNDERHRWVLSGVVELPWGMQFAPIMQLASARAYNAIQGRDVFGIGGGRGNAHAIVNTSDPNNLLANAALSTTALRTCLAAGTCIQSPFDQVRGQAFFQLDTRLSKAIKFGERSRLNLIFQAFDLTNRANFGNNYDGNVRNTSFAQPLGYITPSGVIVPHSFSAEFGAHFSF